MADTQVEIPCVKCSEVVTVTVPASALAEFTSGGPNSRHVQSLFPNLTPAEREMFIAGICGVCWNRIFDGF